jgi:hypothetical protein
VNEEKEIPENKETSTPLVGNENISIIKGRGFISTVINFKYSI